MSFSFSIKPDGFDIEMAERFVNIPEDEIYSLEGGY